MYQQMNENAQMGQATAGVQQMQPQVTMEQQQVQTPQYEVLEEAKKGLFGIGATPAKIHASYRKSGVAMALEFLTRLTKDMGLNVTMEVRDGSNDDKVIAIDGGHRQDACYFINYLKEITGAEKPFIDAWFFTHAHKPFSAVRYRAKPEVPRGRY